MIPEADMHLLEMFMFRNRHGEMELDARSAPEFVIELAKKYNVRPYDDQNIKL